MPDYAALRDEMIRVQIQARGVGDQRLLDAFRAVPRHLFVPASLRQHAYEDSPVAIGCDQTISQPYMVACMTALLAVQPDHRVLEIGTGSGYQAAILAHLAREVFSVERVESLGAEAAARLAELRYDNVTVVVGDGTLGWPEGAPYDRILVTAGGPQVPETLRDQLAVGGRLVCPVGDRAEQILHVVTRTAVGFETSEQVRCKFVPLIGEEGW